MQSLQRKPFFIRYEPVIFLALLLAYLLPVLGFRYFPTLDGPVHLYNANIIGKLLGGDPHYAPFFELSLYPEPNMLGHFLLGFFNTFLPAWLAEKIVLVLYAAGMAFSFRMLVRKIKPDALFVDYLVFPFIYSFTFCIGFFNFCLSVPLCFFSLYAWLNYREQPGMLRGLGLSVLLLLTYFAHASGFFMTLLVAGIVISAEFFRDIFRKTPGAFLRGFLRNGILLTLAAIPAICFTISFLLRHGEESSGAKRETAELLEWLFRAGPLVTLFEPEETPFSYTVAVILGLLLLAAIFFSFRRKPGRNASGLSAAAIVTLALYFLLPDEMASGGYVSVRLLLFFYLLLILWMAVQPLPRYIAAIAVTLVLGVNFFHLHYHYKVAGRMSGEAEVFTAAAQHIPAGSTVLPLNYSLDWLHSNFASYMAADKAIIVLDNYEAVKPHFFTRWTKQGWPYDIGNYYDSHTPCVNLEAYKKTSGRNVDFVALWHWNETMTDSCTMDLRRQLGSLYMPVFTSDDKMLRLFRRK
ncbi:MAG: hypothetical protein FD123_506 [Bacteroidetes bacterium]|nr:MAG: hypothetical protein FD123_506 [Bacteroidota bacterium]